MEILRRKWKQIDFVLVMTALLLCGVGVAAIYASTLGKTDPNIPSHAWMKQIVYGIIGFIAMWVVASFDYQLLRRVHWWMYGIVTFLLAAVYAPFIQPINGARSWIPLPGFSLQPSEFAKLAMIITLAALMAHEDEQEEPNWGIRKSWKMWLVALVPAALTLKEPALGQAIVLLATFATVYVVFLSRRWFVTFVMAFIAFGVAFIALPMQFPKQSINVVQNLLINHHLLKGYQADRILTWLNPNYQPAGAGYEIHQAETAIGSGGLFGEGWLHGLETVTGGIPNQWTDYIFTGIAEEFGFVGASIVILLFLILVYRLIRIAATSKDTFGTYIVVGTIGMIAFQVFENVGMDMYMSPSTGITLPFVSYGGSSLLVCFVMMGLAISVRLRNQVLDFSSK